MIEHYRFGRMVINGIVYEKDLILSEKGVQPNWWRKEGHRLSLADIQEALDQTKPKIIIIGTGHDGLMKIDSQLETLLAQSGIQLIAESTADAIVRYGQFICGPDRVMGAFHLTC